ncbi:PxKF domain-containing protein [Nocardioides korecus]
MCPLNAEPAAGGSAGQPGSPGSDCSAAGVPGGEGGQAGGDGAPGNGGKGHEIQVSYDEDGNAAVDPCGGTTRSGAAGSGHNGGTFSSGNTAFNAGGGGGGWYGGGQGADGCVTSSAGGGGGGSNHYDASATNPSTGTSSRDYGQNGLVTITYTVTSDTTAPVITSTVNPATPDGANGWYKTSPTVHFDATDTQSPITSQTGCDDATVKADTTGQTFTCSATSSGGTAVSDPLTIKHDATAPSVAFDNDGTTAGGSYVWGTTPAAPTCTATDATSGVDSSGCVVTGYSTTVGSHTLTATATDKAGNTATATSTYTVKPWTTSGFYAPVNMGGVLNTVKGGSTVPTKFKVAAGSTPVTDPVKAGSITTAVVSCNATAPTDPVEVTNTAATSLRYDATSGQFIYNWQTPKTAGTCYKLTLTTPDGTPTSALFQLK